MKGSPCSLLGIIVAALVFLLLAVPIAVADTLTGKVVKITDGDTLYVLDANYQQHKIRLAGAQYRISWLKRHWRGQVNVCCSVTLCAEQTICYKDFIIRRSTEHPKRERT